MEKEIIIQTPYAKIYEVKSATIDNDDCVRIYCRQFPNVYCCQIRTHKPILSGFGNKGKNRNIIASVDLTISQVEQILNYMKENSNLIEGTEK